MAEVVLTIQSPNGSQRLPMQGDRLTIGSGTSVDLSLDDPGLSRQHLSIYRDDNRVWVLDSDSTNGSLVNGVSVPASGAALSDGDKISVGEYTTIWVAIDRSGRKLSTGGSVSGRDKPIDGGGPSPMTIIISVAAGLVVIGVAAVVLSSIFRPGKGVVRLVSPLSGVVVEGPVTLHVEAENVRSIARVLYQIDGVEVGSAQTPPFDISLDPARLAQSLPGLSVGTHVLSVTVESKDGKQERQQGTALLSFNIAGDGKTGNSNPSRSASYQATGTDNQPQQSRKLYLHMTEAERNNFISLRARDVSRMMSNREYQFTDDVLPYIKQYVDGYAKRVGNGSGRLWAEDLNSMFSRAWGFAPDIIRAFNQAGVRPVVGLYIVMIETEYHNIKSENSAGAAGLFQFIGSTARAYGVNPADRTDVKKMAPAAARYMAQRISDFGTDAMSVALGIAGYNRSPESVMRDLHDVLNSDNEERSFWTLVANSTKLDRHFQGENVKYVPKFFAAAIVGENPEAFGLQTRALSTYAEGIAK